MRIPLPLDVRDAFFAYWTCVERYPHATDLGMGMPSPLLLPSLQANDEDAHQLLNREERYSYQPPGGFLWLRELIATYERQRTGLPITEDNVMVVAGALRGFSLVLDATATDIDTVIELLPSYPLLAGQLRQRVRQDQQIVVIPPRGDGVTSDIRAATAACTSRAIVILTNPCNPTGIYAPVSELTALVSSVARHGGYVVVDEACDIPFNDAAVPSYDWADNDRVVRINSFSKNLLLAGVRLGYVVACKELIDTLRRHYAFSDGNAPTIANSIIHTRLRDANVWDSIRSFATNSTQAAVRELKAMPEVREVIAPEACYYILFRPQAESSSWELFQELLLAGVNVVPGTLFGLQDSSGWLRLCCARDEETIREGLGRLRAGLRAIQREGRDAKTA